MGKVVETIYGKYSKYEIVKSEGAAMGLLGNATFHIYRDGEYHRGSFSSLSAAVQAARRER